MLTKDAPLHYHKSREQSLVQQKIKSFLEYDLIWN